MSKYLKFSVLLILLFLIGINGFSQKIMSLNEVKAGMKGYGLTVIRGEKPVRFDVEIIDVIHNISPKRGLILAKFSGAGIEKTGVAQGMSGSPVYINGKLIGALAYTWGYLKEAVGGIQPIEAMLPAINKLKKRKKENLKFISLDKKITSSQNGRHKNFNIAYLKNSNLLPIKTPLLISGFSEPVFQFFKEKFEELGFSVIKGGGTGKRRKRKKVNKSVLGPGDAVGVRLASGDSNIAALGTVTYVKNDKVLIFGHPFLNRGFLSMPMTKAFVHYVMPVMAISWKFASATETVGRVYNDVDTALAGEIGKKAHMFPIKIKYEYNGKKNTFNYKLIPDPLFFPNIFAGLLMSSVFSKDPKMSEGSISVEIKIKVKRLSSNKMETIKLKDFFIGTNASSLYQSVFKALYPIQYLVYNWFEDIQMQGIEVNIKKVPYYKIVNIEKAVLLNDHNEVKPGDNIKLRLFLRLYKGGYIHKDIKIYVPKNTNPGSLFVNISSAKVATIISMFSNAAKFVPRNFEQLKNIIEINASFNDIAIWTDIPQNSVIVNGHYLPNLPVSKMASFAFRESGNSFSKRRTILNHVKTNYLISGYLVVPIKIVNN